MIRGTAKSLALRTIKRGRRNPDWGKLKPVLALSTEFEIEVARLGLRKSRSVASADLKCWCDHHRNRLYVPEWLLTEWGCRLN